MARMTVGLDPELAMAYLGPDDPSAHTLHEVVRELRAELAPQTPGLRPEEIEPSSDVVWFTCEVADVEVEPAARLLEVEGVRAAFVVPPEGPP